MAVKGDERQKKDTLKNKIIKELYFNRALSCADLSDLTHKSIPLITKVLKELVDDDFVIEQGIGKSTGGRRPLMYSLKPGGKLILAVAVDQLSVQLAMYDLMHHEQSPIAVHELNLASKEALPALLQLINTYIRQSGFAKENIIAIGLSVPGFVDVVKGINYTFLDAGGQNLRKHLIEKTGLPVYIDNDSCVIALAELRFGLAKTKRDVLVVNVAWGIGLGMVLNGSIFRGYNGFAGEFSHIPVSPEGNLCSCGKLGCLETEASLFVVAEKFRRGVENGSISGLKLDADTPWGTVAGMVMEAAIKGDQFSIELLTEAGFAMGKGIAVLIHIINPQTIIFSGRGAQAGKIILTAVQQALHKYAIPRLAESTELLISQLGSKAALIGAAALVMEHFGEHSATKTIKSGVKVKLPLAT
jgi:predicted NBD/HSP70 family sugar kinase